MNKKVAFSPKPSASPALTADEWVSHASPKQAEAQMKRLTLDVPSELHARIKSACALKGVKMSDELRRILEENFG